MQNSWYLSPSKAVANLFQNRKNLAFISSVGGKKAIENSEWKIQKQPSEGFLENRVHKHFGKFAWKYLFT